MFQNKFKNNLNAYAWLWKDHSAVAEAGLITEKAKVMRPEYLAKCGVRTHLNGFGQKYGIV